jgi:hypothetical protein
MKNSREEAKEQLLQIKSLRETINQFVINLLIRLILIDI